MLRGLGFLSILVVLAAPAAADEAYKRCIDGSDGTNSAWGACGGEWVAREDAKLNAAWKRLYEASGAETKKDLLDEQRAWNAFKEKSCRFYGNGDFGREGQVLQFPACRAEVIAQRTEALKRYEAGP
ncbi:lysozyme inhibitor LprI family protein [Bosea thiooxidans]